MSKNQLVFSGQNAHKSLRINDVQFINSSPVFIPWRVKNCCKCLNIKPQQLSSGNDGGVISDEWTMKLPFTVIEMLKRKSGSDLRLPSDCELLSLDIEGWTGVHIGATTLKRLLGFAADESVIKVTQADKESRFIQQEVRYNNEEIPFIRLVTLYKKSKGEYFFDKISLERTQLRNIF